MATLGTGSLKDFLSGPLQRKFVEPGAGRGLSLGYSLSLQDSMWKKEASMPNLVCPWETDVHGGASNHMCNIRMGTRLLHCSQRRSDHFSFWWILPKTHQPLHSSQRKLNDFKWIFLFEGPKLGGEGRTSLQQKRGGGQSQRRVVTVRQTSFTLSGH